MFAQQSVLFPMNAMLATRRAVRTIRASEIKATLSPLSSLAAMESSDIELAKSQVQGQMATQYLQEVMMVINNKCFNKCVTRPGPKLDDSEKVCLAKCMDRYLDTMALVSQSWIARNRQQAAMQGGGMDGLQ